VSESFMPPIDGPKNEMIIRDASHPRAVINLVPEAVARAILRLPDEYVDQGESELKLIFDERKWAPSTLDDRIRFSFWKEYDNAQTNIRQMIMTHVYYGLCSRESFYLLLQNKHRVAWMLCPPADYMLAAEEALTYGLEQLRDVLSRPHTTLMGAVDARAAGVKLEIVRMLDARVKGAIIQTTRNLNVNMNANRPVVAAPKIEDIDQKIKELEDALKTLNEGGKSTTLKDIEVTPTEVTGESRD
jgi:hypothetical protein